MAGDAGAVSGHFRLSWPAWSLAASAMSHGNQTGFFNCPTS
jgi:hypothetical protein